MVKLLIFSILLSISIFAKESFISEAEYGRMLYKNPRGVSCALCHGKKGEGNAKIAKYYDENKNPKFLVGEKITAYSYEDLKASLANQYKKDGRKKHKVMPTYNLSDKEIKAIYIYLKSDKD
jgi:cytochrome c553